MKHFYSLFAFVALFSLLSCTKDTDQKASMFVIPSDRLLSEYGALKTQYSEGEKLLTRDYQHYLMEDENSKFIISTIQQTFIRYGYPLNDLEQTLKSINDKDLLDEADGRVKTARELLVDAANPDIILELDYNINLDRKSEKRLHKLTYALRAIDAKTNKVVATIQQSGKQNESDDNAAGIMAVALDEDSKDFVRQIDDYFSKMKSSETDSEKTVALKSSDESAASADIYTFEGTIKLTAMIPSATDTDQGGENLSSGAQRRMHSKMLQILMANGIGGIGADPRYVFAPIVNVRKKGVTSGAPSRCIVSYDVTFYVADIVTGTVFGTIEITLQGTGNSSEQAAIDAFRNIASDDARIQKMLHGAQQKIIAYYKQHGSDFIRQAEMLIAKQDYGAAMAILQGIPTEASDVYTTAVRLMRDVASKYLAREASLKKQYEDSLAKKNADEQARYMAEMQLRIAEASSKCLLDKYKKDAAYNRLPWLRKLIYLGDNDPFDGYTPEKGC